jgi:AcrR family transcriptional regulator
MMDAPAALGSREIFAIALGIARGARSWDAVRMQDVALAARLSVAELVQIVSDRDAIAEVAFDIADEAMLAATQDPSWPQVDVRERLARCIESWLAALPPERRIVRGMLAYKVQPEHVHLQVRAVMRISRTVQTMREIALLRATGLRREAEEAALTSIYLATFASWLAGGAGDPRRLLAAAHRIGGWSG